jgi:hypothetical protein
VPGGAGEPGSGHRIGEVGATHGHGSMPQTNGNATNPLADSHWQPSTPCCLFPLPLIYPPSISQRRAGRAGLRVHRVEFRQIHLYGKIFKSTPTHQNGPLRMAEAHTRAKHSRVPAETGKSPNFPTRLTLHFPSRLTLHFPGLTPCTSQVDSPYTFQPDLPYTFQV